MYKKIKNGESFMQNIQVEQFFVVPGITFFPSKTANILDFSFIQFSQTHEM